MSVIPHEIHSPDLPPSSSPLKQSTLSPTSATSATSSNSSQLSTPSTASFVLSGLSIPDSNATRRRSVDTGGLALALRNRASGRGWGDWGERENGTIPLAEFLSKMFMQTVPASVPAESSLTLPLPPSKRAHLIQTIGSWAFDPHSLSEDDVFSCVCLIFELLFRVQGMHHAVGLSHHAKLRDFLLAIRSIYNERNTYHNYQHALDVLQAMYIFLVEAACIPPISILLDEDPKSWPRDPNHTGRINRLLSNVDVFILCVSAIGHDVGHPGLNNAFMKNACTPLSNIFNHTSALERMHCTLLLSLMRNHGLGHLVDPRPHMTMLSPELSPPLSRFPSSSSTPSPGNHKWDPAHLRMFLVQTVLATDMSIHAGWMTKFESWAEKMAVPGGYDSMTPHEREDAKILVCQALLKCADISNPCRPHAISELWSTALISEWTVQASLEQSLSLPISVPAKPLPIRSQPVPAALGPPTPLLENAPRVYRHHARRSHTPSPLSTPSKAEGPKPSSPLPSPTPPSSSTSSSHHSHHTHSRSHSRSHPQHLEDVHDDPATKLQFTLDQAKGQLGFIQWFAGPLFGVVAKFAPREMGIFEVRCNENKGVWEDRLKGVEGALEALVIEENDRVVEVGTHEESDGEEDTFHTPELGVLDLPHEHEHEHEHEDREGDVDGESIATTPPLSNSTFSTASLSSNDADAEEDHAVGGYAYGHGHDEDERCGSGDVAQELDVAPLSGEFVPTPTRASHAAASAAQSSFGNDSPIRSVRARRRGSSNASTSTSSSWSASQYASNVYQHESFDEHEDHDPYGGMVDEDEWHDALERFSSHSRSNSYNQPFSFLTRRQSTDFPSSLSHQFPSSSLGIAPTSPRTSSSGLSDAGTVSTLGPLPSDASQWHPSQSSSLSSSSPSSPPSPSFSSISPFTSSSLPSQSIQHTLIDPLHRQPPSRSQRRSNSTSTPPFTSSSISISSSSPYPSPFSQWHPTSASSTGSGSAPSSLRTSNTGRTPLFGDASTNPMVSGLEAMHAAYRASSRRRVGDVSMEDLSFSMMGNGYGNGHGVGLGLGLGGADGESVNLSGGALDFGAWGDGGPRLFRRGSLGVGVGVSVGGDVSRGDAGASP